MIDSGYAPVNGLNMYYEIHGKGDMPLAMIHGGGSTIESFETLIPLLAPHFKIIAVELQAHGRTSDRNAPERFETDADDVAALLEYLKINKACFLGFSNGGTTTLQIAIRHPEIIEKIVVISANYRRDGMIPGFFEGFPEATLESMPESLKIAFLKVMHDPAKLQIMFEKDVERMSNFKDIPDEWISSIKAPSLIIVGDQDVVTVDHALKLSKLIPGARFAVLPGTHGSFIEDDPAIKPKSKMPEMTANMIREFLKG